MNIVFAGTPAFALPALCELFKSEHKIISVYTQPDRPAGRGRKLQVSPVKAWALENNVPIHQPLNFKTQDERETLKSLQPDVMVVIAYGLILPKEVLEIPRFGCINVHASLLPAWRGASPIQHAILHGDSVSGVSIMQMDAGMDTGAVYTKEPCTITKTDNSATLHDKLAKISAKPLLQVINSLVTQDLKPCVQNDNLASYAPKISKSDAEVNWHKSSAEIDCLIRAYNPWPVAYSTLNEEQVRIHRATVGSKISNEPPGTIIAIDKNGILVTTGDGSLLIEKLQFPGKKVLAVADWLNANSTKINVGMIFQ